jgi:hypothetical protein
VFLESHELTVSPQINRQVLARMIKKLGHPYEEAEDGGVGVAKYKTFHPSLGKTFLKIRFA